LSYAATLPDSHFKICQKVMGKMKITNLLLLSLVLLLAGACGTTNSGDTRLVVTPEARRAAEAAQQADAGSEGGAPAEPVKLAMKDPDEVICRAEGAPTGTRLGKRRICATRAEWDALSRSAREETERIQDSSKTCISGPSCN
jgi:hypothetical protein